MAKMRSCTCPRRKKSKRSKSARKKCYRPGIVTRNPFLNFLRKFRRESCGKSIIEIARAGGEKWKGMTPEERCKYKQQAWKVPKCVPRSIRRKKRSRSKRRSRSMKRMRSCTCKRSGRSRSRLKSHSMSRSRSRGVCRRR